MVFLLDSLETDKVDNRLVALQSLREEVLTVAEGSMPKNTARVLIEIMKELVRVSGDEIRRLKLAREFRIATSGKPRLIRKFLRRYHLLEMPEEWNQIAFDDHVHDAATKGRKSGTHLIMDAWIKGIRRLRVIYYNHIHPVSAMELLEAARIMGIDVRIGIEFAAQFRGKYVQLIWVPRGFVDSQDFLCFLAEPRLADFMIRAREVSAYRERGVMAVLDRFNDVHRPEIEATCAIPLPRLDRSAFKRFVGTGQASLVHLSRFIHRQMMQAIDENRPDSASAAEAERGQQDEPDLLRTKIEDLDPNLDPDEILSRYLSPSANPDLPDPSLFMDSPDLPDLLRLTPRELAEELSCLRSTFRITLNLSNLDAADVLEILYDCEGAITRLEIFNLKDYINGKTGHLEYIDALQRALNSGNTIAIKRIIQEIIEGLKENEKRASDGGRIEKLQGILHDIGQFKTQYKLKPLKARIGSDSTGRSVRFHGMGLVVVETLPKPARLALFRWADDIRLMIPMRLSVNRRITHIPHDRTHPLGPGFCRITESLPLLGRICRTEQEDWLVHEDSIHMESPGNIVTLGGVRHHGDKAEAKKGLNGPRKSCLSFKYLRTDLRNGLKVFFGFVPAFATFFFKYDWWVLAWLGAPIWFAITGFRNIVQSVLGGGGLRRSPLLRWNDYVSWERLTDSLLYTGFSVPLLDLVVKTWVLDQGFGIDTMTAPIQLYAWMALANGIYISGHNIFRGLPRGAIYGNFFRSILSIPIAVFFNSMIGLLLGAAGVVGVESALQKWAAVISKLASDCVAGIIEGAADRYANIRRRLRDYQSKSRLLFDIYAELEMLFPERDVPAMLNSPAKIRDTRNAEAFDLEKIIMINALDMLYFWMYQPRSRSALRQLMQGMSDEERKIFTKTQSVLRRHQEISLLLVNGILGANFMKALAFYLDRSEEYLKDLEETV